MPEVGAVMIAVFGRSASSAWGNGHATHWRALGRALAKTGVHLTFFEKERSYYASSRDADALEGIQLVLYQAWREIEPVARALVRDADVAIVTSFCPDAQRAAELVRAESRLPVYYDLDTPVTLASLDGEPVPYLPGGGLAGFPLVLSFTGGAALDALARRLGAARVRPLYGCVDVDAYAPEPDARRAEFALSYLGSYAADRQPALASLFVEPARRLPERFFLLGGARYPDDFPWTPNTIFLRHVAPGEHRRFYGTAPLTLNVTRAAMARLGHCPSTRLFEAAACGAAIISDAWPGIEEFFEPGEEILLADSADDVVAAIELPNDAVRRLGARARARVFEQHSADRRARELLGWLDEVRYGAARRSAS